MSVLAVAGRPTPTNVELVSAWRDLGLPAQLMRAEDALDLPVSTIVGRLDVLPSLDGIERGLVALHELAAIGVRVVNSAESLLRAHDKLATARAFLRHGVPHPRTLHVTAPDSVVELDPPLVVKPRFGSWGQDVVLCETAGALHAALRRFALRPWFQRHGALVQEFVPCDGHDLRVVVAGGEAIGAFARVAAPGEWRTNVSIGGRQLPAWPSPEARDAAVAAVAALGGDLMGADLMPTDDGWIVLEVNGAVEFDGSTPLGDDVYADAASALLLGHLREIAV